jgi:hypothetical protein
VLVVVVVIVETQTWLQAEMVALEVVAEEHTHHHLEKLMAVALYLVVVAVEQKLLEPLEVDHLFMQVVVVAHKEVVVLLVLVVQLLF